MSSNTESPSSDSSILKFNELPKEIIKHSLKFRTGQNGLLLKIHHTIVDEDGYEMKKIRFINVAISQNNQIIAAIDHRGNIFIFSLCDKNYWQLPDTKVHKSTTIDFIPHQTHSGKLLIGNKLGFIYEIEINSGTIMRCIKAFTAQINHILFPFGSNSTATMFLASTSNQIKIYDVDKFMKKCEFTAPASKKGTITINLVKLIPHDDKLLVVLSDDSICILTSALKVIKHVNLLKAKEKYLQKSNQNVETMDYFYDSDEVNVEKLIKNVTQDYRHGTVKDISFTENGRFLTISCLDSTISLLSTTMWDVRKLIKFPDISIKQSEFVNNLESNAKTLVTLTSNDSLLMLDLDVLNVKTVIEKSSSDKFVLSLNGKFLASILKSGEVLIYNMDYHLAMLKKNFTDVLLVNGVDHDKMHDEIHVIEGMNSVEVRLTKIQKELNKTMPKARLLPILKEFGEYPEKYRVMIWKTILKVPQNKIPFTTLLERGYHSCVTLYGKRYPLADQKALNNLKKIVSCLAHWSQVFGHVEFLPNFVFPFLKHFKSDSLACFEVIASILYNHCQLWFEFVPLQTPYNYLGLIENVLLEFDRNLFEFYKSKDITAFIYALPLMETAFSEVFDVQQWMPLWDHIVSNENYFMIFVIVAYNIMLRATIMKYDDGDAIEQMFHEQNYVDLKKLVKKSYNLMDKCPNSIHPMRYMKPFVPLVHGQYQKFTNYPKNLIGTKTNEIKTLKQEQQQLDIKIVQLQSLEKNINDRMESCFANEEHDKRMKEVEKKYEEALTREEERVTHQRKLLLLYQKKIRERENEMLIEAQNNLQRKSTMARENELEKLLRNLEKQRIREETEMQLAEENMKIKEMDIMMKKFDYDNKLRTNDTLENKFKCTIEQLSEQKQNLLNELNKMGSSVNANVKQKGNFVTKRNEEKIVSPKIESIEDVFHQIQDDYVRIAGSDYNKKNYKEHMKKLEEKTELLEYQIHGMLSTLKTA